MLEDVGFFQVELQAKQHSINTELKFLEQKAAEVCGGIWMAGVWMGVTRGSLKVEGGVVSVFSILGSSENKRMRDEHLGICLASGKNSKQPTPLNSPFFEEICWDSFPSVTALGVFCAILCDCWNLGEILAYFGFLSSGFSGGEFVFFFNIWMCKLG